MVAQNLGNISGKIYDLLSELSSEDRIRVVQSALALFSEEPNITKVFSGDFNGKANSMPPPINVGVMDSKEFFKVKEPHDRGEQLAVAARYLEHYEDKESLTKEDFAIVFKDAKRNFDAANFARDMSNAKNNAKFFISGGKSKTYKLSFYGEEYVDALPDRNKAAELQPSGKKQIGKKKKSKSKLNNKE